MLPNPRGLGSRGRNVTTRRHNNDCTQLKAEVATESLWAPQASESPGRTRAVVLAAVTDPDYQGETGWPVHSGSEEHVWNTGDP